MNATLEPVMHGFGTLLAAEHELLNILRGLLDHPVNSHPGIGRILEHHIEQLGMIIGLLQQRDQLLPHPVRFGALAPTFTLQKATTAPQMTAPLANLEKRNQSLRLSIELLIEHSGNQDEKEKRLREAAQRHGEMEWMLASLLNEDAMQTRDSEVEGVKAETMWENEGGRSHLSHSIILPP